MRDAAMTTVAEQLRAEREAGATTGALVERAAELLGDAAQLSADLVEPEARIAEAGAAWEAMETFAHGAYSRYPAVRSGGFHGGTADLRPSVLYGTPGYIRQGDVYSPAELEEMQREGRITLAWRAAECVRLSALLETLPSLMDSLDSGSLGTAEYALAVTELATAFGKVLLAR